jgi:hypothetical protein
MFSKIAVAVRDPTNPATTPTYNVVDVTTGASNTMFFTVPEVTVWKRPQKVVLHDNDRPLISNPPPSRVPLK